MFVNDEMLRNALKARKEPPKTACVAEESKTEQMAVQERETAPEAAVGPQSFVQPRLL